MIFFLMVKLIKDEDLNYIIKNKKIKKLMPFLVHINELKYTINKNNKKKLNQNTCTAAQHIHTVTTNNTFFWVENIQ